MNELSPVQLRSDADEARPSRERSDKLRVFICYASKDRSDTELIVGHLKTDPGIQTIWDQEFRAGQGFPEQIKAGICYSHIFMPIVSRASSLRGWVHQEIGYASAMNIPVLPIAVGDADPAQMIHYLHAIKYDPPNDSWKRKLSRKSLESLVQMYDDPSLARFECAPLHEERTMMLVQHTSFVWHTFGAQHVRQRGALSSFHIPTASIFDQVWKDRNGGQDRGAFRNKLQRVERMLFMQHAREAGCSLIINPHVPYEKWGSRGRRSRLGTLLAFFEEAHSERMDVKVAVDNRLLDHENLTLVGNHYCAEAIAAHPDVGYRQTVLTTHAPSMQSRIREFDAELKAAWEYYSDVETEKAAGRRWTADSCVVHTIDLLRDLIRQIPEDGASNGESIPNVVAARKDATKRRPRR